MPRPVNYNDGDMLLGREVEQRRHQAMETDAQQLTSQQMDFMRLDDRRMEDRFDVSQNAARHRNQEESRRLQLITLGFKPLIHSPEKSVMTKEFSNKFKARVSDKARLAKQRNKRSRLYQKNLNLNMINNAQDRVADESYERLEAAIGENQLLCEREEINDLAAFMTEDAAANAELTRLYLGDGDEKTGMDMRSAMDKMYETIMSTDIGSIKLENDKEIARNADKLERLSNQVMAFDKLCSNNGYWKGVDEALRERMQEKLEQVRSVVNYYCLRKDIITDKHYASHYNDELSMDITMAGSDEEKALAEKLLKAYTAGKYMMEKNNFSQKKINALGEPKFTKVQDGKRYLKVYEESFKHGQIKDLLKDRYSQSRKLNKADEVIRKNKKISQQLVNKSIENLKNYKGEIDCIPNYEEEAYNPQKVKECIEEIKKIDIKSLKCKSIKDMVDNYAQNYDLCSRVEFLHHQVVRGLMHGYSDEGFDDAAMVELRAKTNFFLSFRKTLCSVNSQIAIDNSYASKDSAEWKDHLESTIKTATTGYVNFVYLPGESIEETYKKYRDSAKEENDTKDETIKTAYKLLNTNNSGDISEEELNKKRQQYNKNAIIQDYMSKDGVIKNIDPTSGYIDYLTKKAKKEGKLVPALERTFAHMCQGKSAKEIERLFELATGNQKQRFDYYIEVLRASLSYDINKYNATDMGTFFDDWTKKGIVANLVSDNLKEVFDYVKSIIANSKGELALPEEFGSMEEMEIKTTAMFDFGCGIMAGRVSGLNQLPSTKYIHTMSVSEIGSYTTEKLRAQREKIDDLVSQQLDGELPVEYEDAFKDLECLNNKMYGFILPQDKTKKEDENQLIQEVYNFTVDADEAYQTILKDVKEKYRIEKWRAEQKRKAEEEEKKLLEKLYGDIPSEPDDMDQLLLDENYDEKRVEFEHKQNAKKDTNKIAQAKITDEVLAYTGHMYHDMNTYLRTQKETTPINVKNTTNKLKEGLKKCKIDRTVVVSRGIEGLGALGGMFGLKDVKDQSPNEIINQVVEKLNEANKENKEVIFTDPGFVSTSYEAKNDFVKGNVGIELIIKINKGTSAVNISGLSYYDYEKEILINAGTKFRLIKVYNAGNEPVDGLEYRETTYDQEQDDLHRRERKNYLKIYLETIPENEEGVLKQKDGKG